MYKVEIDQTLSRSTDIYRRVGLWRSEEKSDFRSSCIRILHFLQYLGFSLYLLWGSYHVYLNEDKNQLTFLVEAQITVLVLTVKLAYLLWRKDEMLKFLNDPIVTHGTEDYDQSVEIKNKIEKIGLFYKVYVLVVVFATLFEILLPLPIFTNGKKVLPGFILFNLESHYGTVIYWTAYLYGSVNVAFSAFYIYFMLFVWYIMYNYAIKYELLGHRIRSLGTTTSNTYQQELMQLVRAHSNLFDTAEKFRSCFAALFLVEIFTGAVSICVATYNLAYNTADNVFQMLVFVALLFYAFSEIFLTMYFANEITIESDRLSYCLFESNWTDQPQITKKCVTIICEIIRRPQRFAISFYPMNLDKLTSIVNGAYRMFNILQSFK